MANKNKIGAKFKPDTDLKLLDQVRQVMRYHHYAYRTEKSYCDWIVRYVKFHIVSPLTCLKMGSTSAQFRN
ncbi:MAG: phage integrase N-terminal SAM-like domain-containing protein [Fidelibacterota bacterium]